MEPAELRRWRNWMGLSQKEAAAALGLKRRVVQYYEKGERNGEPVKIPRSIPLACYALANGVTSYHGPGEEEILVAQEKRALEKKNKKRAWRLAKMAKAMAASNAEPIVVPAGEPTIPEQVSAQRVK